MKAPGKSPSVRRRVVIAGAFAVLASAMTTASAAAPAPSKPQPVKKHKLPPPPAPRSNGGSSGLLSLEWAIGAALRP